MPTKKTTTKAKKTKTVVTTHITFLIDRSGSMAGQRQGVIDGFREYVQEQQAQEGEMTMTVIQFDSLDPCEVLVDGQSIADVPPGLLADLFQPRGMTPLYDATAKAIDHTRNAIERGWEKAPDHVVVVVFTDGFENNSHEHSLASLTALVKQHEDEGWTFVYLGEQGTHDVYAQAGSYGTRLANTSGYAEAGAAFASVSKSTSALRGGRNAMASPGETIASYLTNEEGEPDKLAEDEVNGA